MDFGMELIALYFLPLYLFKKNRKYLNPIYGLLPTFKETLNIAFTFCITCFAWIFFRAESLKHAMGYINQMISIEIFDLPNKYRKALPFIIAMVIMEWLQRDREHGLQFSELKPTKIIRWGIYMIILIIIVIFIPTESKDFIYFQF